MEAREVLTLPLAPTSVLAAALLLLAPLTLHPDGPPAGDDAPAAPPLATVAGAPTHAFDVLREAVAARDASRLPSLAASLLAGRADAEVATATASADDARTVRIGLPVGDLTGDGVDDALVWRRAPFNASHAVDARSGADGALLWTRGYDGAAALRPVPTADLDADGREDVVVATFTLHGESTRETCAAACIVTYDARFTWGLDALSGATGAPLWQRTYDGNLTVTFYLAVVVGTYTYDATNLLVGAFVPPPGSPAGSRIVIDRYDVRDRAMAAFIDSTGEVLDAATGAIVQTRVLHDTPDVAILYPTRDAVGDASPDYVWDVARLAATPGGCWFVVVAGECLTQKGLRVEMIDGATGSTAWAHARDEPGTRISYGAGADLDGDARADVLVLKVGPRPWEYATEARAGATGDPLWPAARSGVALVAGDIDGGAGVDVLLLEPVSSHPFTPWAFTRVDGATGAPFGRTERALYDGNMSVGSIALRADHDGDGVRDVVMDGTGYLAAQPRSMTIVESGATGDIILQHDPVGHHYTFHAGDVDADGVADLLRVTVAFRSTTDFGLRVAPLAMPAGEEAWAFSEDFASFPSMYVATGGDMTGDGGADLIVSVIHNTGTTYDGHVRALDGATGAVAWETGAPT